MANPTIGEVADKLTEYRDKCKGDGASIPIDPQTLAWAEYWLRFAKKHCKD